jgi:hypothetical protein
MMWSERQRTASSIAAELHRWEPTVWVLSPLPLADGDTLRFQVRNQDREAILAKLSSWGLSIRLHGELPRVTYVGLEPASVYSIELPRERQTIVDDRAVKRDEIVSAEVKAFKKLHGLG